MAPIKEFSGSDLGRLVRFNGVGNTISKIGGVSFLEAPVPEGGFLLDQDYATGAAAAYATRQLSSTATNCMRIVIDDQAVVGTFDSNDTNEYDIGFDSDGNLDIAAIEGYCDNPGGTNYDAYVTTWYDQSGNDNHATQATHANMPKIAEAGVVITENGKPALSFYVAELTTSQFWPAGSSDRAYSMVCKPNGSGNNWMLAHGHSGTATHFIITQEFFLRLGGGVTYDLTNAASTTQTHIFVDGSGTTLNDYTVSFNGTVETGTKNNGTTTIATSNNVDTPHIGTGIGTGPVNSEIQEVICWNFDQSTNRTAIETNVMTYFGITLS